MSPAPDSAPVPEADPKAAETGLAELDGATKTPRDLRAEKERVKKLVVAVLKRPVGLAQSVRSFLLRVSAAGALATLALGITAAHMSNGIVGIVVGFLASLPAVFLALVASLLAGVVGLPDTLCDVLDGGADLLDADEKAELEALAETERTEASLEKRPGLLRRIYEGAKRLLVVKNLFDDVHEAFTSTTKVLLIANPLGAGLIGLSVGIINLQLFAAVALVVYALP